MIELQYRYQTERQHRETDYRIQRLENTAREAKIGEMFPNIAAKPGY